ncbi:unnamed protein product [Onchocerca ochengi]|uniref:SERTA domain-containing protein n=1 Tax=Onchocerca ochengi TaxID=42157 RepID=A0A182EM07_ONCOC|nr:unnamed protein product [Onchocerca ochengi]
MMLLFALSQSSYSSSSDRRKLDDRACNLVDDVSSASVSLLNSNTFVSSILTSDNNASSINYRQPFIKLEQSCINEPVLEMDLEKNDGLDNSSIHFDESSSFDASSVMNESASLNEHRRTILDLSISKIQTMNASNVAVSLRKSLLIYNTMKSLQRDLDTCGILVCDSVIERGNEVIDNDVEMLEANEFEEVNWKHPVSDFSCNIGRDNNSCNQHLNYDWPWGTLINTNQDTMQDSEKYESDNVFTLTSNTDLFNTGNIWSNSDSTDSSAFVDDYLGMLCAWEDENYNPLTNCNLTRAEIMNMFHLPSYHLNNQLISQA